MKVIVCGGRNYSDKAFLYSFMDVGLTIKGLHIIVGGAPGADSLAEQWARDRGVPFTTVKADWSKYGKAAGPLRNRRMLEMLGYGDRVIAFPGGNGTANIVKIAKMAQIPVYEVGDP